MKKNNSAKTAFVLLSMMTFASASGAIGSTLAWYAYSTRALVSYSGTSVSETSLLEIGICSDEELAGMPSSISRVTYAGDSNIYYFSDPGKGLTYDIIEKYLAKKGYATNELEPTTSGSYASGDDENIFGLKQAPNEIVRGNTTSASKDRFVRIPFVFRVQGGDGTYYDDKELWLTKTVARASSDIDGDVYKAIRMFVDRDSRNYGNWQMVSDDIIKGTNVPTGDLGHAYYLKTDDNKVYSYDSGHDSWTLAKSDIRSKASTPDLDEFNVGDWYYNSVENKLYSKPMSDFIVNPSANVKGRTRVGGVLNINRDNYYDYDNEGEILYGEYDPLAKTNLISSDGYDGGDDCFDVNGVGNTDPSTFVAKHYRGVKYYSDFSSDESDALFKHAEYESVSNIAPTRDTHDYIANVDPLNPTSVCKTRADDNHLARVTMTIYLEGWDFSVIDEEIAHSFDLGLTFEMSRL